MGVRDGTPAYVRLRRWWRRRRHPLLPVASRRVVGRIAKVPVFRPTLFNLIQLVRNMFSMYLARILQRQTERERGCDSSLRTYQFVYFKIFIFMIYPLEDFKFCAARVTCFSQAKILLSFTIFSLLLNEFIFWKKQYIPTSWRKNEIQIKENKITSPPPPPPKWQTLRIFYKQFSSKKKNKKYI